METSEPHISPKTNYLYHSALVSTPSKAITRTTKRRPPPEGVTSSEPGCGPE